MAEYNFNKYTDNDALQASVNAGAAKAKKAARKSPKSGAVVVTHGPAKKAGYKKPEYHGFATANSPVEAAPRVQRDEKPRTEWEKANERSKHVAGRPTSSVESRNQKRNEQKANRGTEHGTGSDRTPAGGTEILHHVDDITHTPPVQAQNPNLSQQQSEGK